MFDIGFSELLVIALVALVVLGPERLPKAARFAGLWVRRARAHWNSVKAEFENELASEDLQRTLRETREALRSAEEQLRGGATALQSQLEEAQAQLHDTARQAVLPLSAPESAPADTSPEGTPAHHDTAPAHPEMTRSQVDHALLEPPPPADEDDDEGTTPVAPPQAAPAAPAIPPMDPGTHSDAGR